MSTELLACPFCGSKPKFGRAAPYAQLECRNCGCNTGLCHTRDQAHEYWNRRAPPSMPQVPDGWKLVPIEPTPEMCHAATMIAPTWDDEVSARKYKAMLSAAPSQPEPEQP